EKAGKMMWNDIVNANCARANTTGSQPANICAIRHCQYGQAITLTITVELQYGDPREDKLTTRRRQRQIQSDPEGGIPSGSSRLGRFKLRRRVVGSPSERRPSWRPPKLIIRLAELSFGVMSKIVS